MNTIYKRHGTLISKEVYNEDFIHEAMRKMYGALGVEILKEVKSHTPNIEEGMLKLTFTIEVKHIDH